MKPIKSFENFGYIVNKWQDAMSPYGFECWSNLEYLFFEFHQKAVVELAPDWYIDAMWLLHRVAAERSEMEAQERREATEYYIRRALWSSEVH